MFTSHSGIYPAYKRIWLKLTLADQSVLASIMLQGTGSVQKGPWVLIVTKDELKAKTNLLLWR